MSSRFLTMLTALGVSPQPASGTIFDHMEPGGYWKCASCQGIADPVAMDIPGITLCEDCAENAPALVIGVGRHFDHFRQMIEGNGTWMIKGEVPDEKGRGMLFALVRKSTDNESISP